MESGDKSPHSKGVATPFSARNFVGRGLFAFDPLYPAVGKRVDGHQQAALSSGNIRSGAASRG
jgi:hypothetical protein